MTTTAYLDLFLRSIHEPALLQTFLSFILLHTHDNVHILDTLVSRVNTPFQVGNLDLTPLAFLRSTATETTFEPFVVRFCPAAGHRVSGSVQDSDRSVLRGRHAAVGLQVSPQGSQNPSIWFLGCSGACWVHHLVSPQVSDSLQPPEQEAAFLLKPERLLLLQRRLLPAPHALLVPRVPPKH